MKVALTYCGTRRNSRGQRFHLFVDKNGEQANFGGSFRGVFIGNVYEAEVKKNGGMTISSKPKELEERWATDDECDKWRALERVAEQEAREERVKKKLDSMKGLLDEIPAIKRAMRGLHAHDQHVFMQWLWNEIDRENREKLNREMNELFKRRLNRAAKVKK